MRLPGIPQAGTSGIGEALQAAGGGAQSALQQVARVRAALAGAERNRRTTELETEAITALGRVTQGVANLSGTDEALSVVESHMGPLYDYADGLEGDEQRDAKLVLDRYRARAEVTARSQVARNAARMTGEAILQSRDSLSAQVYDGIASLDDADDAWLSIMQRHRDELGDAKVAELTREARARFALDEWRALIDDGSVQHMQLAMDLLHSDVATERFDGAQLSSLRNQTITTIINRMDAFAREGKADQVEPLAALLGDSAREKDAVKRATDTVQRVREAHQKMAATGYGQRVKDTVTHMLAVDDIDGLRVLQDEIRTNAPEGMADLAITDLETLVGRSIKEREYSQRYTTSLVDHLQGQAGVESHPQWRDAAVENAAFDMLIDAGLTETEATTTFVERLGYAPARFINAIERHSAPDSLDTEWLATNMRAVAEVNPMLARRLSESRPMVAALLDVTAGRSIDDPAVQRTLKAMSAPGSVEALAQADAALERGAGVQPISTSRSERRQFGFDPGTRDVVSVDIARALTIPVERIEPEMRRRYTSAFRAAYVETATTNPASKVDERIEVARQQARQAIADRFITISDGQQQATLPLDALGLTAYMANDPERVQFIEQALSKFRERVEFVRDSSTVMPHLAVPIKGKTYVPAGSEGATGPDVTDVLEIDPLRMESRMVLRRDPDFHRFKAMFTGGLSSEDFGPFARYQWSSERPSRVLADSLSPTEAMEFYELLTDEWDRRHPGATVDPTDPDFVRFAREVARTLKWSALDTPSGEQREESTGE